MEQQIYQMYLEELKHIPPLNQEERDELLERLAHGEKNAASRLIEGSLQRVLDIAGEYAQKGIPLEELVLEGNMALTLAVEEFKSGDFDGFTADRIRESLENMIQEQQEQVKTAQELLARVNVLQKVSQIMAEELGREATVEELAEKMKMTTEEIKDIMKLTLDAISVDGQ